MWLSDEARIRSAPFSLFGKDQLRRCVAQDDALNDVKRERESHLPQVIDLLGR